jgi:hypothetical protein
MVLVVVGGVIWAVIALAPRQPRPRLVSDPQAAPAASCGAFGAEPSDPADGSVGFVPCTLPDGFVLIEPPVDVASSSDDGGRGQPYVVYYSRMIGDGAPDSIAVITVASDVPEVGGDTVVRGHPARLVEPEAAGGALQLRWTERPGINVQISAWGEVSVAEILEVAASLEPRAPFDPGTTTVPPAVPGDTTPGTPAPTDPVDTTSSTGPSTSAPSTSTTTSTAPTSTTTTTTTGTSTTSTESSTTTTGPISTTNPISVPPVVSTLVPTLPSTVTSVPDLLEELSEVPVVGELPIIGDLLDGDDEGDAATIDGLPVLGDLDLLGGSGTTPTTTTATPSATTPATSGAPADSGP